MSGEAQFEDRPNADTGGVLIGPMGPNVGLDFGTAVTVIGFSPQEAADFAVEILRCAMFQAKEQGMGIEVKLGVSGDG